MNQVLFHPRTGTSYKVTNAFYIKARNISIITLAGTHEDFTYGDVFVDATGKEYVFKGYPMVCYKTYEKRKAIAETDVVVEGKFKCRNYKKKI